MLHACVTVLAQLTVGYLAGRWLLGGGLAIAFYAGREIAQAEYRWIQHYGSGRRANMSFWAGVDPAAWTLKSALDIGLPILACALVYLFVTRYPRRFQSISSRSGNASASDNASVQ